MKNTVSLRIRRITVSALFLSVALVLKTVFTLQIPLFGQNGMTVGISGVFSMMPALLFGPLYGAITSGLADLLGYILKPTGAYIPWMTLIIAGGGALRALLWRGLRHKNTRKVRLTAAVLSALLLAVGVANVLFLREDGIDSGFYDRVPADQVQTDTMHLVSRMLIIRTVGTKDPGGNLASYITFLTAGVIGSALLGMLLLGVDLLIARRTKQPSAGGRVIQLLITLVLSGLAVTTLNTVVLRETLYESWKVIPFIVLWIPRAIEEVLGNTVKAYLIALLMELFNRQPRLRELTD